MYDSIMHHPRGLQYYLMLLGAWLLRLPAAYAAHSTFQEALKSLPPGVSRTRMQIPSRDKERSITVDVYEKAGERGEGKKKVHLNMHGSGFVLPSLGADIDFCALLASKNITVLDTDYRKAPEYPFPSASHDVSDILTYIASNATSFDTSHITISGFSAGAALAMTAAVAHPLPTGTKIAGVVSFYGNPDMTVSHPAPSTTYDNGMNLPPWLRRFFYNCYILPSQDRSDPRLSAAYADVDRWPAHVFVACGTADSLFVNGEHLVKDLVAKGHGDVTFLPVENEAHAFDKRVKKGSVSEKRRGEMYGRALEMIERAYED